MRIVLPALFLALAAPVPAAAPPTPAEPSRAAPLKSEAPCPYDVAMRHARERGPMRSEKLGELPPADMFQAVARKVDGCLEPVIVRQNIGAGPGR
ncbi:MAG: hypothetical protein ACK40O_06420 [Allosphingosinicella sp.]